jgi:hypothetical protein
MPARRFRGTKTVAVTSTTNTGVVGVPCRAEVDEES